MLSLAELFRAQRGPNVLSWVAIGACTLIGCDKVLGLDGVDRVTGRPQVEPELPLQTPDAAVEDAGMRTPEISTCSPPDMSSPLDCTAYCTTIQSECTGSSSQFQSDLESCMAFCPHLDPIWAGCRGSMLSEYPVVGACSSAGPGGMSSDPSIPSCACSACDSYCSLLAAICPGTALNEGDAGPYATHKSACVQACDALPMAPVYAVVPTSLPSGNNVNCRIYHLNLAAETTDPMTHWSHCEHAVGRKGSFPKPPCQDLVNQ